MKKLIRDQQGIAAVEFGILALPLFVLIMGSIELGMNMFVKAQADGILRAASRMATTGDVVANGPNGELIDAFVKNQIEGVIKNTKVEITKTNYDRFSQVRRPESKDSNSTTPPYCWEDVNDNRMWDVDPSREGLGGGDDIINYRAEIEYPALFPLITNVVTRRPTVRLVSETTLRNEPFAGGSDMTPKTCCISAASGNPVTCK